MGPVRRWTAAALVALPALLHAQATPLTAEGDLRGLAPPGVAVNEVNVTGTTVKAVVAAENSSDVVAFLRAVEGSGLFAHVALAGEESTETGHVYHLVLRLK